VRDPLINTLALELDRAEVAEPHSAFLLTAADLVEDAPANSPGQLAGLPVIQINWDQPNIRDYLNVLRATYNACDLPVLDFAEAREAMKEAAGRWTYLEKQWHQGYGTLRRLCDAVARYYFAVRICGAAARRRRADARRNRRTQVRSLKKSRPTRNTLATWEANHGKLKI
jgi:hypothetical protein